VSHLCWPLKTSFPAPRGHLGELVEYSKGKSGESVVAIMRFLYGSPRLSQLRTEGLVSVSKYWTYRSHIDVYGPSKSISMSSTEGSFTPTALMAALGEKLSRIPRIDQPTCCWLCQEPFFLGAVALFIAVDDFMKGCHVRELPVGNVRRAYVDWRGKRTCRIGWVFPCKVYIDSNHHDS
jgi:hypothetical protein